MTTTSNSLREQCAVALTVPNVRAFLRVIRAGESSQSQDAYRTIVGGQQFASTHDHPRIPVFIPRLGVTSTAAGAYQFLSKTWDECVKALELKDFEPHSQDLAAVYLIRRRGALDDVREGRLEQAITKCRHEWASLPGDAYGQGGITMQRARDVFAAYGGTLAPVMFVHDGDQQEQRGGAPVAESHAPGRSADGDGGVAPTPAPAAPALDPLREGDVGAPPVPAPTKEKQPMAPLIPALVGPLVGELAKQLPRIAALWGNKSEVAERNIALGSAILETVSQAVGASNAQEAVERIKTDPAAAQAAREAIDREWAKLDELREASIERAREWARTAPDRIVIGNMVFHEVLALVMVLLTAAGMFAAFAWGGLDQATKNLIVTAALIGGFLGIKEFFFGGSRGSDTKTSMLVRDQGQR